MKVGLAMLSLLATEHQRCNIHDIGASRNLTLAVTGSRSLPVRSWKPWFESVLRPANTLDKPNLAGSTCGTEQTISKRSAACAGAQIRC